MPDIMCHVDWAAIAAWVQAAILGGAFWLAWRQLEAFKDSERVKLTISQIDKFRKDGSQSALWDFKTQVSVIQDALALLSAWRHETGKDILFLAERITLLETFFDETYTLYRRHMLHQEMYMETMDEVTLTAYILTEPIISDRANIMFPKDFTGFRHFAQLAQQHYRSRTEGPRYQELLDYDFDVGIN